MQSEITIKNLKKYFAEIKAVDDISFTVQKGELFGFLGVNGAGKSTTIRMMCTLFSPTDGEIWIGGQQVGVHDEEIRQKIGVVWQENVLDDRLTVKENLQVRAAMYQTKRAWQKERIQTVCEKLHLEDIYTRRYAKLSGGQKRRCEIAAALLNDPEVLFLDEPTTGLDPATRKQVWNSVESLQCEDQVTVFLTTHYMEEAAAAGHIAIIDKGKLCEFGTPQELKMRYAKDTLTLYYKQEKHTLTSDNEEVKDNIISYMNYDQYIFPVGRLDKESQGLIIMTNDGVLANKILESDNLHEKEYVVTVDKDFDNDFIRKMADGVDIGDVITRPCKVEKINNNTFKIILTQGLNKQIRRMTKAFGYTVIKLERIRIMNIKLDDIEYGTWRNITEEELKVLKEESGL